MSGIVAGNGQPAGRAAAEAPGQRRGPLALTRRFMAVAIAVIAAAMLILGALMAEVVRSSITEGVAKTAAASIEALIANSVGSIAPGEPLSADGRTRLDRLFEIGSDADATRLIQLRIFRPSGEPLYEAVEGIADGGQADRFARAVAGEVTSDVVELPLEAAGPFGSHPIKLLRLYTPLHESGTDNVFGVAALYYSARSLLEIQSRGQTIVWIAVLVIGIAVVLPLLAFVSAAERTITRQRASLAANLARSQQLSAEIGELHKGSEQLRIEAIDANEQLLARVGSDIHDGPLQLLTLAILQMTRGGARNEGAEPPPVHGPAVQLTTEAMTELRNISVGLVLPEISGLTLEETLALAVRRHEAVSGSSVAREFIGIDRQVDSDIQVCLYRVVQESLSNAYRHSGGYQQSVRAQNVDGAFMVEISNGLTATPPPVQTSMRPRLGLRGMQLRLEAVGGSMTVEMREDSTVVRAIAPDRRATAES